MNMKAREAFVTWLDNSIYRNDKNLSSIAWLAFSAGWAAREAADTGGGYASEHGSNEWQSDREEGSTGNF